MEIKLKVAGAMLILTGCSSGQVRNPWSESTAPVPQPPEVIGAYDAGCLAGGISPSPDGEGYSMMRLSRRRYYGHSSLVTFIEELGRQVKKKNLGTLLVGDLAQPRGGPAPGGHASHQSGLDVDIWYSQPLGSKLSLDERESLSAGSVLDADKLDIDLAKWKPRNAAILQLAAEAPEVERVFVTPAVKRELCVKSQGAAWLAKIRPWWGHDDHFHVRLRCPSDSKLCRPQLAVPGGDGCDSTLNWWFSEEARETAKKLESKPPGPPKMPVLPEECMKLIGEER